MDSLARRTLRTAAAVAGIAAVGVGVAVPAFAAPSRPGTDSTEGTDGAAPAAPEAGTSPNVVGDLPAPDMANLPQLFTVEGTSVYTAGESQPQLPAGEELPLPTAADIAEIEGVGSEPVDSSDVEIQTAAPQDQDGAMQGLDATSMFGDLTGTALGSTQGNTIGD
jgi:hypothetical protein